MQFSYLQIVHDIIFYLIKTDNIDGIYLNKNKNNGDPHYAVSPASYPVRHLLSIFSQHSVLKHPQTADPFSNAGFTLFNKAAELYH